MGGDDADYLRRTYERRFDAAELATKQMVWQVLVDSHLQRYVPRAGTVVDLGAGSCEFVNAVSSARRVAVDLNPDVAQHAADGVEVLVTRADSLSTLADATVDTVFSSNFFEHLPTKDDLLATLAEARRVTRPGGLIVVLMPNIRYLPGRYWDYLDHHLPLTHLSLSEALALSGYDVEVCHPRFLPYTVKDSRLPVHPVLVRTYLRLPWAWRVLGRQMLVVARRG